MIVNIKFKYVALLLVSTSITNISLADTDAVQPVNVVEVANSEVVSEGLAVPVMELEFVGIPVLFHISKVEVVEVSDISFHPVMVPLKGTTILVLFFTPVVIAVVLPTTKVIDWDWGMLVSWEPSPLNEPVIPPVTSNDPVIVAGPFIETDPDTLKLPVNSIRSPDISSKFPGPAKVIDPVSITLPEF